MQGQKGFSQLELVVVLSIIGVAAAIALPQMDHWNQNAQCRQTAREMVSALREARSRAIAANRQHRLEVDLAKKVFRLRRGNRPYNSTGTSWVNPANLIHDWQELPAGIVADEDCDQNEGIVMITFNSSGSSDPQYLCVMGPGGERRFRLGVSKSRPGKIDVRLWNPAENRWE